MDYCAALQETAGVWRQTKKGHLKGGLWLCAGLAPGGCLRSAYFSRASTDWLDWLAWASMAVAACWMICVRASSVVALA